MRRCETTDADVVDEKDGCREFHDSRHPHSVHSLDDALSLNPAQPPRACNVPCRFARCRFDNQLVARTRAGSSDSEGLLYAALIRLTIDPAEAPAAAAEF